ncbi:dTDP-4-dehydrorhamnose 3,5-epimerase [Euhalothece natronophila Z-M001]|uniref:dTDP-4-dehydrorhamnose 3,5-epimerase n=1 Tax=Euhalothece natronophila Z-M001 TaxID=522448 RepID=A0A5B8NI56_9CHRO|nr:dTDP-4-dehydrorhamnose 3,5-epimerase [Euhalothece natronophila]QDZ38654.1 dTDP-4-dehydrorhamnose 3,5-epimerase [Euhalothece natronophila Z-M001]
MHVTPTAIPEILLIEPTVFGDERGFFMETWQRCKFAEAGIDYDFVQDNHSRSVYGTLRGLHYQICKPQGKLVRVTRGEVFDVAVDLRQHSPTFGQWVGEMLSSDNKRMLWVPPGFAHGFYVTSDTAEFQYKCTDYYSPECERSIHWNDPKIGIAWPIQGLPLVSEKDEQADLFEHAEYFAY